jgi:hypothetical protein
MSDRIPSHAGKFAIVREKRIIRGRSVRVASLVFTAHDGFVGESIARRGRFDHREAYEAANAARARALVASGNAVPKPYERCNKPAPAVQLLHAISEHLLFSEVERRGYEVAVP